MKKMMLMAGALAMLAAMTSCSSSSKAPRKPQTDMVEQVLPLSGPQYRSDAEYYRAVQSGVSPEQSMAKKIAMQNARQEIAAAVQTDIATVMENYAKAQKLPSQTSRSYEERVTELTYAIVKQSVSGMTLVEEKLFKEANMHGVEQERDEGPCARPDAEGREADVGFRVRPVQEALRAEARRVLAAVVFVCLQERCPAPGSGADAAFALNDPFP